MSARFYLETYGCSLNMADSDLIVGRLHACGFSRSDDISSSDVVILNTCGVKEPTEDKIISRLRTLSTQDIPIIITGCLPRISLKRIINAIPNYAAILGPQSLASLGPIASRVVQGESGILHLSSDDESKLRYYENPKNTVVCTIPICEGCVGECAYCAVRFARSHVRSYSIQEILGVIRRSVHNGFKEIRLTAQDIGAFGHDTGESLIDLLHQSSKIEGSHKFRLGMFNPNLIADVIDDFLDVMASERFFRFFHVPLQSGSDKILQAMKRRYTVAEWMWVISRIKERFPDATVATDIIVGFPGETESDFESTLDVIMESKPSVINVSKYGDRPGTAASVSKEKVNTLTKKERSRHLSLLVDQIVRNANSRWIGWKGPVLVTGRTENGRSQGRTPSYKLVLLKEELALGEHVDVVITDARRTHLIGELEVPIS